MVEYLLMSHFVYRIIVPGDNPEGLPKNQQENLLERRHRRLDREKSVDHRFV